MRFPEEYVFSIMDSLVTLLLQKDAVELTWCLYQEPVYTFLMIPSQSHHWSNPANAIG